MKKYLYPILTLCWVALIFSFSLQPADASAGALVGLAAVWGILEFKLAFIGKNMTENQL